MSDTCKGAKNELVTLARRAPEYWKSPEDLHTGPPRKGEFPGGLPVITSDADPETSRRDFLTLMGFGAAAATVAACRAPEQKAIPMAVASDELIPGVPNFYATTCGGCASACSLLVKQRDGRPIKIEGNDASVLFGGATCATGQATVLSLYDQERLHGPVWKGAAAPWLVVDDGFASGLEAARSSGAQIVLLTGTITSPTLLAVIERWRKAFPLFRHVSYDAVSMSGLRAASAQVFGKPIIPHYAFDRARVIVSLDADFLGTWLSPVEFARQYARARTPDQPEPLHVQIEPGMSITGANADQRIAVAPSQIGAIAAALLSRIARRAGQDAPASSDPIDAAVLDSIAASLWKHRGESLVVAGGNDAQLQLVVHTLNRLLDNVGKTLDVERHSRQRQGDDAQMAELVSDMARGRVHTLILHDVNPAYDYADPAAFLAGLTKVALSISTADRRDETASAVHAVCPDHHFLESWGDAEPVVGHFSLMQPTIAPLYETRSLAESLVRWIGEPATHYNLLRDHWRTQMMPSQANGDFDSFWDKTLERGVFDAAAPAAIAPGEPAPGGGDWHGAITALVQDAQRAAAQKDRFELAMFESVAMGDGKNANNPWLLELPDPVTGVTWDNVCAIAPSAASKLGLRTGDNVAVATPSGAIELPVFIQPGQHPSTVSVAVGWGHKQVGKAGNGVGANAFPLAPMARGARRMWVDGVTVASTGRRTKLAETQRHFSMEGRPIVLETTRAELGHGREEAKELPTLWHEREMGEKSWGLSIDLNACTGCSACVIACQAENNVPVIGKDQVERQRIMHWIRIDRYYSGSEDNPQVVHQPMMCQHCGHAPCETVCPVLATTTSAEGLNQQVYNRCIGTRYCANNCPYKVRRFNWYNYTENSRFDYNMANPVGRLVLNPDVTVRSRGVMEKCSMCVQRIAAAKNASVKTGEPVKDGQIKTACQQACPTDAIVFGDLNDPHSRVAQRVRGERNYRVLDDLGTRPNVAYLKKVRHGQAT